MHEIIITCNKYGRQSQFIVKQESEFNRHEIDWIFNYALDYFDCDDLHLKVTVKKIGQDQNADQPAN